MLFLQRVPAEAAVGLLTLVRHRWKLAIPCPGAERTRSGWLSNAGAVAHVVSPCRLGGLSPGHRDGPTSSRAYELSLLLGVDPDPPFWREPHPSILAADGVQGASRGARGMAGGLAPEGLPPSRLDRPMKRILIRSWNPSHPIPSSHETPGSWCRSSTRREGSQSDAPLGGPCQAGLRQQG